MATTEQHRGRQSPPRVAVAAQFRLVVETVGRSLVSSARIVPIPLEDCARGAACDAVLRAKASLAVVVLAVGDTLDVHGLVADLAARGQLVVVVGQLGGNEGSADLLEAGAIAALEAGGVAEVRELVARIASSPGVVAPARRAAAPAASALLTVEQRARRNLGRLTPAEARILWRLMHGSTVAEIAEAHVVSVATVRSQIRALLTKLETGSQLAAVALAWRVGWVPTGAAASAA